MRYPRAIPEAFRTPPNLPSRENKLLELDVRIMTAIYGGGAEAGRNDAFDPFRIPSIRGQLRFWWRATRGAAHTTVQDLHKREGEIWGQTDHASKVRFRMLSFEAGKERPAAAIDPATGRIKDKIEPQYVLFAAQEDKKKIGRIYEGGRFRLEVEAPDDVLHDVDAALWAWFTFGGIGARTRRGCGSLYCEAYSYKWNPQFCMGDGRTRAWPTLHGGTVVMGGVKRPWKQCWEECIRPLQAFRQDRPTPRSQSRWPEPDEIRRLRRTHSRGHDPVNPERGFPRAALGLPIVFHFKDERSGDPGNNTLTVMDRGGANEGRMASPVILKPWAVNSSEAIPLLVVLNAEGPRDLVLRQGGDEKDVEQGGRRVLDEFVARCKTEWKGQLYGV